MRGWFSPITPRHISPAPRTQCAGQSEVEITTKSELETQIVADRFLGKAHRLTQPKRTSAIEKVYHYARGFAADT